MLLENNLKSISRIILEGIIFRQQIILNINSQCVNLSTLTQMSKKYTPRQWYITLSLQSMIIAAWFGSTATASSTPSTLTGCLGCKFSSSGINSSLDSTMFSVEFVKTNKLRLLCNIPTPKFRQSGFFFYDPSTNPRLGIASNNSYAYKHKERPNSLSQKK